MSLAWERTGAGTPLVLVHGLGSSRRAWDLITPHLCDQYSVYAVDLPGHGESEALQQTRVHPRELAAALGEWLDDVGLNRAHLVGNSMGGWVCLEAAASGRAESVTALCPAGFWAAGYVPRTRLRQSRMTARRLRPALPVLLRAPALRRTAFGRVSERADVIPFEVALTAARAQADAPGFDACLAGMTGSTFTDASKVPSSVPVTIVFGDRDRVLPAPVHQERANAPGHAQWIVRWRTGHTPMWDIPRLTAEDIRRTVERSVSPTPHSTGPEGAA